MKAGPRDSLVRNGLHFLAAAVIAAGIDIWVYSEFKGQRWVLVAVLLFLALQLVIAYFVVLMSSRLDEISPRIGIRTTLVEYPEAYRQAIKAVGRAQREILIVSNWALKYQANPKAEADRKRYFAALMKKAQSSKILFERVAQFPDSPDKMEEIFPLVDAHLRECMELRDFKHKKVGIYRCSQRVLVSFTLIDSNFALLQLDEFNRESNAYQVYQAIIIEGESGEIFTVFRDVFDKLKLHSHAIEMRDLAEFSSETAVAPRSH